MKERQKERRNKQGKKETRKEGKKERTKGRKKESNKEGKKIRNKEIKKERKNERRKKVFFKKESNFTRFTTWILCQPSDQRKIEPIVSADSRQRQEDRLQPLRSNA